MLTPAYNLTATERVLPRMALDFTTGVLDSRVTVTRALDTATRVNSSGYVEVVNANLPRFDYDPVTLAARGLLIEESRANLLSQSQAFNNTSFWVGTNTTVSTDAAIAPDGAMTADGLLETITNGIHRIYQAVTVANATSYTWSGYVRSNGRSIFQIVCSAAATVYTAEYNLSAVTTANISGSGSATITSVGNGWYRVTATATSTAAGLGYWQLWLCSAAGVTSYVGDVTKGVYLYGAQLEAGAFATSYIPTTTTSLTRNADQAAMTGTNFSDWWTSTIGTAVARVIPSTVSGTRPAAQFDDNSANNIIALRGNTTNPELYIRATTDQAQIDAGTISANTTYLLGGAWNTNDCAAAVNGGTAVPDTSVTVPTATQARLGSDGTNYLNGCLQSLRYWPQRVTNAEIQAFSK